VSAAPELTEAVVADHTILIITTPMPKNELIKWNEFCRSFSVTQVDASGTLAQVSAPISFMYCFTGGAFGSVFVDLGDKHMVLDPNGERPMVRIVTEITNDEEGLVRFVIPDGEKAESLPEGCSIEFEDVEGMFCTDEATFETNGVNINKRPGGWRTYRKKGDPFGTLRIGDTTKLSPYMGGGTFTEKKTPTEA